MRNMLDIFIHIPKTGGTSFNRLIQDHYSKSRIAFLHDDPEWSVERLIDKCKDKNQKIQIISGHFSYGIHEYIERPYRYITILRNPIELVISLYDYIKSIPLHQYYHLVVDKSLHEFISEQQFDIFTSNLQSKLLGLAAVFPHFPALHNEVGVEDAVFPDQASVQQHLRRHFACIGVMEKYRECLQPMRDALGWKRSPKLYKENSNPNRTSVDTLERGIIEKIARKNSLDTQLYLMVVERWYTSKGK